MFTNSLFLFIILSTFSLPPPPRLSQPPLLPLIRFYLMLHPPPYFPSTLIRTIFIREPRELNWSIKYQSMSNIAKTLFVVRLYPVNIPTSDQHCFNFETTSKQRYTTSKQRCFNLESTLVKAILNPVGLVMTMDLQIDIFILLNEKTFFTIC